MRLPGLIPPWAYAAIAAVALSGAFAAGWKIEGWRWSAHEANALKQAQIAFQKQLDKQNDEATKYEQDRQAGQSEGRTRETAIRTIYKDRPVAADCAAPDSVRGVLGEAVSSANTRAAGQPGATLSETP